MTTRTDSVVRLASLAMGGVLFVAWGLLTDSAREAHERLERQREQLEALAELQVRASVSRTPDFARLDAVRGLFGAASLAWIQRDGCSYLTFVEPAAVEPASARVAAAEVSR